MSVSDFYDELASEYDLIYYDWDAAVEQQGRALDRLIGSRLVDARSVLDCSCGIGTQALGLASLGYRVHGTDISESSVDRARREADRLGLDISLAVSDFRDLGHVRGTFDVVISCDNALPHLLTDDDIEQAFRAMWTKLRPGGLLLITVRDYDKELVERPATALPRIHPGPAASGPGSPRPAIERRTPPPPRSSARRTPPRPGSTAAPAWAWRSPSAWSS